MDYHDAIANAKVYSRRKGRAYAVVERKKYRQRNLDVYYLAIRHRLGKKELKRCVAVVLPSWVIIERKLEE